MVMLLEKELKTFDKRKEQLLVEAKGRFVLIKGDEVLADFASYEDALSEGYRRFGNESFLVQEVQENGGVNFFTRSV